MFSIEQSAPDGNLIGGFLSRVKADIPFLLFTIMSRWLFRAESGYFFPRVECADKSKIAIAFENVSNGYTGSCLCRWIVPQFFPIGI